MVLCIIGAFAINMAWQDILTAVIFGFIGFGVKRFKYSNLGLILGLILGPIAESSFHQAIRIGGGWHIFYESTISKVLLLCIIASIAYPIMKKISKHNKAKAE